MSDRHGNSVVNGEQAVNAAMLNDATVIRKVDSTVSAAAKGATARGSEKTPVQAQQGQEKSNRKFILIAVAAIAVIAVVAGGYVSTQQIAEEDKLAQQEKIQGERQAILLEQQKLDAQQAKQKAKLEEEKRLAIRQKKQREDELAVQKSREEKEKQKAEQAAAAAKQVLQDKHRKINTLLTSAEQQLHKTRLSRAHQTYKKVLKLDPANKRAKSGVVRVADSYLSLAEKAAARYDFDKTNSYINSAIQIDPLNSKLKDTQQKVLNLKKEYQAKQAEEKRLAEEAVRKRELELKAQETSANEPASKQSEQKKRRSFGVF